MPSLSWDTLFKAIHEFGFLLVVIAILCGVIAWLVLRLLTDKDARIKDKDERIKVLETALAARDETIKESHEREVARTVQIFDLAAGLTKLGDVLRLLIDRMNR